MTSLREHPFLFICRENKYKGNNPACLFPLKYCHIPFGEVFCYKWEEIERNSQQLLFKIVAEVVSRCLNGIFKLIMIREFLKGIQCSFPFFYIDGV